MAKIIKLRGPIREFTVSVGAYSRGGGLLIICSSGLGAYSKGGFFEGGGGNSRIYGMPPFLFIAVRTKSVIHHTPSANDI